MGLPGLPEPGFSDQSSGLPGLPAPGFAQKQEEDAQPLSTGEAVAGGFGKLLNSLTFNFGDEATSGVNAVIDSMFNGGSVSNNYDSRLKQARALDEHYSAQEPEASTALGLGGFLTPLPSIFSEAKGVAPAVGNIVKGAGLGSIFGAGYGFGGGEGTANRIANAESDAGTGALLGGPLQAVAEGAQGVARGIGSVRGIFSPDLDAQAQQIAADTVSKYTDPAELVAKLKKISSPDELAAQMTTAEQVRDPGLGLLTKVLENKIPEFGITKDAMDLQRALERNKIFTDPQGVLYSPEDTGGRIQQALSEGSDAMGGKVKTAYALANEGEGTAPIFPAKRAISHALNAQIDTGVPIDSDTQSIVDNFRALPNNISMEQLQGQRQIVGSVLGDLRSMNNADPSQRAGQRILSQLFGHIDDAEKFALTPEAQGVTNSGVVKGFGAKQGSAVEKARNLAAEKGDLFQSGATGKITQPDRYGNFKMQGSDVPDMALSSPEDARQIVKALKVKTDGMRGPDAKNALSANIMETLRDKATNPVSGRFEAARFARNWDNMEPAASEVLSTSQINAIRKVRNDLVGEANFKASVGNASKGQSISSQNLGAAAFVKDTITQAAKAKTGVLGKFLSSIGEGRAQVIESKVDEILTKMSFDPQFAQKFLTPPTSATVKELTGHVFLQLANAATSEITSQNQPSQPLTRQAIGMFGQKLKLPQKTAGTVEGKQISLSQANPFSADGKLKPDSVDKVFNALAKVENTTGDPNAKNPTPGSSARGLLQWTDATAKDYNVIRGNKESEKAGMIRKLEHDYKVLGSWPAVISAWHNGPGGSFNAAYAEQVLKHYVG